MFHFSNVLMDPHKEVRKKHWICRKMQNYCKTSNRHLTAGMRCLHRLWDSIVNVWLPNLIGSWLWKNGTYFSTSCRAEVPAVLFIFAVQRYGWAFFLVRQILVTSECDSRTRLWEWPIACAHFFEKRSPRELWLEQWLQISLRHLIDTIPGFPTRLVSWRYVFWPMKQRLHSIFKLWKISTISKSGIIRSDALQGSFPSEDIQLTRSWSRISLSWAPRAARRSCPRASLVEGAWSRCSGGSASPVDHLRSVLPTENQEMDANAVRSSKQSSFGRNQSRRDSTIVHRMR